MIAEEMATDTYTSRGGVVVIASNFIKRTSSCAEYDRKQEMARKIGIPIDIWCLFQRDVIVSYGFTGLDAMRKHVKYVNKMRETLGIKSNRFIEALTQDLYLIQVGHPQPQVRIG